MIEMAHSMEKLKSKISQISNEPNNIKERTQSDTNAMRKAQKA